MCCATLRHFQLWFFVGIDVLLTVGVFAYNPPEDIEVLFDVPQEVIIFVLDAWCFVFVFHAALHNWKSPRWSLLDEQCHQHSVQNKGDIETLFRSRRHSRGLRRTVRPTSPTGTFVGLGGNKFTTPWSEPYRIVEFKNKDKTIMRVQSIWRKGRIQEVNRSSVLPIPQNLNLDLQKVMTWEMQREIKRQMEYSRKGNQSAT